MKVAFEILAKASVIISQVGLERNQIERGMFQTGSLKQELDI